MTARPVPLICRERDGDADTIRALTRTAFEAMAFSNQTEAGIIDALRDDGSLTLSLVAAIENEIVGHVAFSQVTIDGAHKGWFGLGPISVWPARQRMGIGQALIREGLRQLEQEGASGCVLLGDPAYYGRFGFTCDPDLRYGDAPAKYFQRLVFIPPAAKGEVEYHPAFDGG